MSVTYLGVSANDPERKVVIKIPDAVSEKNVEMFRSECRILGALHHPLVVPILESGDCSVDGRSVPYMVMKFLDGQSLRQRLKTGGKLAWDEAARLLEDVATALDYLYRNRFCHRDIKPDNIIFDTESGHWILVDFGIARSLQDNWKMTMTMAGKDSGTWDYMPPEQLEGKAVDIRCDIYALGTVVWEALIGKIPRRGTRLPSEFGLELPPDVDVLIEKMVEHDPGNRYQTPAEVLQALHSGAKRIESWKKTKRRVRILSRLAVLFLIFLVLLTCGWFTGNFIAAARVRSVYEANRESAVIALRELDILIGKLPFYWGRSTLAALKPELAEKAQREQERMRREFLAIRDQVSVTGGDGEELERRKLLCENFISRWKNIFPDVELREVERFLVALNGELSRRREEKLVEEAIAAAEKSLADKDVAACREAIKLFRRTDGLLERADTKKKLGDFFSRLKREAAGITLVRAETLLRNDSREDWSAAFQMLEELRGMIGDDPALLAGLRKVDDKLWEYYSSLAEKSVESKRFADAVSYLDLYGKSGMKAHLVDRKDMDLRIAQAEETFHWEETLGVVENYRKDQAYPAALAALERFVENYPFARSDEVGQQRKAIADEFAGYIVDQWSDPVGYQENMEFFRRNFPQETENIRKLQCGFCRSIHHQIGAIVFESETDAKARFMQLSEIRYDVCTASQQKYLKQLIAAGADYLKKSVKEPENALEAMYKFRYEYQRPPKDCVTEEKVTVYRVTFQKIEVNLSESHYKELKGISICRPEIRIGPENGEPLLTLSAPNDTRSFSFTEPQGVWWESGGKGISVQVADRVPFFSAKSYGGVLLPEMLKQSGSVSLKLENGTTMKIVWNTR